MSKPKPSCTICGGNGYLWTDDRTTMYCDSKPEPTSETDIERCRAIAASYRGEWLKFADHVEDIPDAFKLDWIRSAEAITAICNRLERAEDMVVKLKAEVADLERLSGFGDE